MVCVCMVGMLYLQRILSSRLQNRADCETWRAKHTALRYQLPTAYEPTTAPPPHTGLRCTNRNHLLPLWHLRRTCTLHAPTTPLLRATQAALAKWRERLASNCLPTPYLPLATTAPSRFTCRLTARVVHTAAPPHAPQVPGDHHQRASTSPPPHRLHTAAALHHCLAPCTTLHPPFSPAAPPSHTDAHRPPTATEGRTEYLRKAFSGGPNTITISCMPYGVVSNTDMCLSNWYTL